MQIEAPVQYQADGRYYYLEVYRFIDGCTIHLAQLDRPLGYRLVSGTACVSAGVARMFGADKTLTATRQMMLDFWEEFHRTLRRVTFCHRLVGRAPVGRLADHYLATYPGLELVQEINGLAELACSLGGGHHERNPGE